MLPDDVRELEIETKVLENLKRKKQFFANETNKGMKKIQTVKRTNL